jgi:hypothetical protein
MTLQSWKDEFYPVDADCVAPEDAIAHSLQKWTGLLRENLEKHDCSIGLYESVTDHSFLCSGVKDRYGLVLEISSDSCALCSLYFWGRQEHEHTECPLYGVHGVNCDDVTSRKGLSPWYMWVYEGNPRPMIALLREALETQKQQEES